MNIVVGGGFLERIGRGERNYARGHAVFLPAGMTHSQLFGATGTRQIIFRPQDSWLAYLADCNTKLEEAPHFNARSFRQFGDRLLAEMRNDDGFSAIAREGILLEIVAAFGRAGASGGARATRPAWLMAARDFLHENAHAPVSLAELARAVGRHEVHLAREFRRYYGVSVGTYLRQLRTEEAARRLLEPRTTISTIALDCGFSSHSHLCREFKAYFGVTPRQYRSHHN
ncbi:MAG: helix-turn-helix transcriptional regulator [Rhizomicrobium sp.]